MKEIIHTQVKYPNIKLKYEIFSQILLIEKYCKIIIISNEKKPNFLQLCNYLLQLSKVEKDNDNIYFLLQIHSRTKYDEQYHFSKENLTFQLIHYCARNAPPQKKNSTLCNLTKTLLFFCFQIQGNFLTQARKKVEIPACYFFKRTPHLPTTEFWKSSLKQSQGKLMAKNEVKEKWWYLIWMKLEFSLGIFFRRKKCMIVPSHNDPEFLDRSMQVFYAQNWLARKFQ